MKNKQYIIILLIALISVPTFAQSERADIREGNRHFKKGSYSEAEVSYKRSLQKNPNSYEASYNLSNSYYKQQRFEDAAEGYSKLTEDATHIDNASNVYYNIGNAMIQSRKLDEAIESYKKSLRINPSDMQAKFNLAYAQKLKKDQEDKNNNKNNQDNNQNNQDNNKNNQNNQNNQNNNNQNNQNNNPNNNNQNNQNNQDNQNNQSQTRQDNERMLNAIQSAEDKTKDKVKEEQAKAYGASQGKQW